MPSSSLAAADLGDCSSAILILEGIKVDSRAQRHGCSSHGRVRIKCREHFGPIFSIIAFLAAFIP